MPGEMAAEGDVDEFRNLCLNLVRNSSARACVGQQYCWQVNESRAQGKSIGARGVPFRCGKKISTYERKAAIQFMPS
jgi:hypothetical protein